MKLINKDFESLTETEFDKTIAGLSQLSVVIVPFLLKNSFEGTSGVEVAAEFILDLQIAADALKEIKQQVCGRGK